MRIACVFVTLGAAGTCHAQVTHDVVVGPGGSFVFSPESIVVDIGDTVRWTWDSDGHNVGAGLPGDPSDAFLSGPPADTGTVFEVLFDQNLLDSFPEPDNLYWYHCHPHGDFGMIGSVTVVPAPPTLMLGAVGLGLACRRRR